MKSKNTLTFLFCVIFLAIAPSIMGSYSYLENVTNLTAFTTGIAWWEGAGSGCDPTPPDPLSAAYVFDDDYGTGTVAAAGVGQQSIGYYINYTINVTPSVVIWQVKDGHGLRNYSLSDDCLSDPVVLMFNVTRYAGVNDAGQEWMCMNQTSGLFYSVNSTHSNANVCAFASVYEEGLFYCSENMTNSSWSSWTTSSCDDHVSNTSRTLTMYDANTCGLTSNTTFTEYTLNECECVNGFSSSALIVGIILCILSFFAMQLFKSNDTYVMRLMLFLISLVFVLYAVANMTSIC